MNQLPQRGPRLQVEQLESREVPAVADLAVTITDNRTEMPDTTIAPYVITVTNNGPDGVSNVTIADHVTPGTPNPIFNVNFWYAEVFGGATVSQSGAFGEFSITANMPAGSKVVISADVEVDKRTSGLLTTTATATLAQGDTDPNTANNTATDTTLVSGRTIPDVGVSLFAVGSDGGMPATVRVYDAPTGQFLRQLTPFAGYTGEVRVATGDVNADGRDDVIVGAGTGGPPHVKVFDGTDGHEIASFYAFDARFTGGVSVAAAQLTPLPPNAPYSTPEYRRQIPFKNVIVGAGPGAGPHVRVFRVDSGAAVPDTPLASFFAFDPRFTGGVRVGGGNVDPAPGEELIVGAGPGGGSHVKVFGQTGAELASFFAFAPSFTGGVFVTGASGAPAPIVVGAGSGDSGQVKMFDSTGAVRQSFQGFSGFNGEVRVATANRNGDTAEDLILGSGPGGGAVSVVSGNDLAPLGAFFPFGPAYVAGVFVG